MDAFIHRVQQGEAHLKQSDAKLAQLIHRLGPCPWEQYRQTPLQAVIRAIVAQQLSSKAAAAIEQRLRALLPDQEHDIATSLTELSSDELRAAGLSFAKIRTLKHLALELAQHPDLFDQLQQQSDAEVMQRMVRLHGIGPWTAEMLLMFGLQRLDVFSGGDLGLRKAIQHLDELPDRPSPEACVARAECWQPFRTIAAWYLWRLVD